MDLLVMILNFCLPLLYVAKDVVAVLAAGQGLVSLAGNARSKMEET